ncbi:WcaG Nucleoside-diphosphate-sugar epimerases [Candidatus Pelagibacterales bacterium]
MKNILLTGSLGLLGRNVSKRLLSKNFYVHGITSNPLFKSTEKMKVDCVDFASNWSEEILPRKIDVIIHLAQTRNFRNFPNSAIETFKVNIESTARLLDYAKGAGVKKFIYASSGGVYSGATKPLRESDQIVSAGELGYYLGSKACSEILVQSYSSLFQFIVLRPFFIYGPGQDRNMLIPRLMDSISSCKLITLQGESGIHINPIHVEDAGAAVVASLTLEESGIFNLAGPDIFSIRSICESMGKYLKKKPNFKVLPGYQKDLIGDISNMKLKLISPKINLLDSFPEIYQNL